MFLDEVSITVRGGAGGRGCVSWRREKYVPKGGPDGGDGGNGGSVFLTADPNTDTLSDFASKKVFEAASGRFGMGKNCGGKNAEDLYLKVPPGTMVYRVSSHEGTSPIGGGPRRGDTQYVDPLPCPSRREGYLLADLHSPDDQILVAHGGRGGYGNAHFVSSVRQRPDFAELGDPGEEKELKLELKLVADVGIIGFPNVGKSTLISVISAARPKIADYPFTTLVPNLGVVTLRRAQGDIRSFVVCDIPGIIEGAAKGKGLGHEFLKHIERCGILLHILDASRPDILDDYKKLRAELEKYSPKLAEKKELVVLNKIDLNPNVDFRIPNAECFAKISATTHQGTDNLAKKLLPLVLEERSRVMVSGTNHDMTLPILRPHLEGDDMRSYDVSYDGKKLIVRGRRLEQFTRMTDFKSPGGVMRFRDVLSRIGLLNLLKAHEGEIFIGDTQVNDVI